MTLQLNEQNELVKDTKVEDVQVMEVDNQAVADDGSTEAKTKGLILKGIGIWIARKINLAADVAIIHHVNHGICKLHKGSNC